MVAQASAKAAVLTRLLLLSTSTTPGITAAIPIHNTAKDLATTTTRDILCRIKRAFQARFFYIFANHAIIHRLAQPLVAVGLGIGAGYFLGGQAGHHQGESESDGPGCQEGEKAPLVSSGEKAA